MRYTLHEWFTGKKKLVIGVVILALLLVFYPVGMMLNHQINDDVDFNLAEEELTPGGSRAVAMSIALIEREVEETGWVANKPFPFPSSLLDNMPNFQIGLMYAMSRFSIEMTDELGRSRGSSQVDPDLDKASGLLKYDGTIWIWEPSTSLLPTASADRQYIAGKNALVSYNRRLAQGQAVFDRRADNLIAFLDRVGADLGSSSASLDLRANASSAGWFDLAADDVFYATKGRLYGYYMILRELGIDYQDTINEKRVGVVWQKMLDNLRTAAEMDPLIISNGYNDGLLMPSHLAVQGFYLLRARTQLKEVANILLK
ncbi:DUF2333 family protein [Denitrobaculum tricleocarpae]|uniref:DUF2333 family protein n=2 Tax=Denitrobaculum tricleocarpae TaxID=2591009 RepID=A0A545TUT0_9PROT|nr:DUF2333 family protein [Denitrobaculum tricleocarpae]